jgi:hypothetical protein
MSFHDRVLPVVTITGGSLMVMSCGGNYGGSCGYGGSYGSVGGCGGPPVITADGYYEGSISAPGNAASVPVVAIIADNGDGAIAGQDGTYYRLNVSLPNNTLTGSYIGISDGANFPNGTQTTSGTISAVATPNLTGTLSDSSGVKESLAFNFDSVYNTGSALANLAGTWSYTAPNGFNLTATIRQDGTFSAMDSNSCTYSGAFSLIDPNFDAYSETYTRSCAGTNVMFTGLATYFPANGGTQNADIKILADDHASEFLVADLQ